MNKSHKSLTSELHGNVLIFQMISTRDKVTNKYLPLLDGNLNVTLNRLFNAIDKINKAYILLPQKSLIDIQQLKELQTTTRDVFGDSVEFIHMMNVYGESIVQTRQNLLYTPNTHYYLDVQLSAIETHIDVAVVELPLELSFKQATCIDNYTKIIYSYNWSYCSHDDDTPMLRDMFELERQLAQQYTTYLYSSIQYDFWLENVDAKTCKKVRLENSIFSSKYIEQVARHNIESIQSSATLRKLFEFFDLHHTLATKKIIFYPSRVEDPRYMFENVVQNAKILHATLIIMNPTNYNLELSCLGTNDELKNVPIIDFTQLSAMQKRQVYFYILSKLKTTDLICRYEQDMHISLIEQTLLTDAKIEAIHISDEEIQQYINND